jgi:O-antigen ligase
MLRPMAILAGRRTAGIPSVGRGLAAALVVGLVVGLLPPTDGLLFALAVAVLLVGMARPLFPLYLLGLAAPLASVREVRVAGVGLSPTEGLVALAAISYALTLAAARERRGQWSRWALPIAIFTLVALISLSWATSLAAGLKELLRWVELGAAFGLVVALVRTSGQARTLISVVLVGALAEGLLGFAQFFLRIGPPSFAIGRFLRAYGTFGQPNPYGGYLAMVLPLAVAVSWTFLLGWLATSPWRDRLQFTPASLRPLAWPLFASFVLLVATAGLAMSLSRGAWLGVTVGLTVMMMAAGRRTLITVLLGLFVAMLVALLGAFDVLPASALERLSSITRYFGVFDVRAVVLSSENWAIVERMAHWQAAWGMWLDHPWLGIGAGQYPILYDDYALPGWADPLGHAHNVYLNVAAEMGTIGLAAYLAMVGSWLVLALTRVRQARGPLDRAIGLGILGMIGSTAVHNLFDNLYVAGMNVQVGILLGLCAAASALDEGARLTTGESRTA